MKRFRKISAKHWLITLFGRCTGIEFFPLPLGLHIQQYFYLCSVSWPPGKPTYYIDLYREQFPGTNVATYRLEFKREAK